MIHFGYFLGLSLNIVILCPVISSSLCQSHLQHPHFRYSFAPFQKAHLTIFVDSNPSLKCSHFAPRFVSLLPYYICHSNWLLSLFTVSFSEVWPLNTPAVSPDKTWTVSPGRLCSGYCTTHQLSPTGWDVWVGLPWSLWPQQQEPGQKYMLQR